MIAWLLVLHSVLGRWLAGAAGALAATAAVLVYVYTRGAHHATAKAAAKDAYRRVQDAREAAHVQQTAAKAAADAAAKIDDAPPIDPSRRNDFDDSGLPK